MATIDTEHFSVRCFKPLYATNQDYTPWFVGHADEESLSDDALSRLYNQWMADGGLDHCEDAPASHFAEYIEALGYVFLFSPEKWLWILPVTQADLLACEARQDAA